MDSPSPGTSGRLLAASLAALVLTACGATQSDRAGSPPQEHAEQQQEAAPEGDRAQSEEAAGDGEEAAGEDASALDGQVQVDERALIHHAELTVRVQDLEEAGDRAKELTAEAGGYLSRESYEAPTGGAARSSLTLRVPTDGYEEVLSELTEMGERSSLERSVEDVTEELADVEGRTESAERSLETLRGYLDEAEGVEEMLEVESRIQERQEDLEAFQARLEALENRTAYSTVELTLLPPNAPDEDIEREEIPGFMESLRSGWDSLSMLGRGIVSVLAWLLPFAVTAVVLGTWPWLRWRARRRRRTEEKKHAGDGDGAQNISQTTSHGARSGGADLGEGGGGSTPA